MKPLTKEERETVVRWSADKSLPASISTHDERQAKRLIRAGAEVRREGERGGVAYWVLDIPSEWARFPKPKRVVTEAQREAARERLAKSRS